MRRVRLRLPQVSVADLEELPELTSAEAEQRLPQLRRVGPELAAQLASAAFNTAVEQVSHVVSVGRVGPAWVLPGAPGERRVEKADVRVGRTAEWR